MIAPGRPLARLPQRASIAAPVARSNERHGGHHDATTAQPDLWLLALARGTTSRVTSDPSSDWFPVWSHDGSSIFFGSARMARRRRFSRRLVSPEVVFADSVLVGSVATYPNDVSQDGRFLLYQQSTSRGYDLGVIPLSGERKPTRSSPALPTRSRVASRRTTGGSPTRRMNRGSSKSRAAISGRKHTIDDDLGRRRHAAGVAARRQRALLHFGGWKS